MDKVLPSTPTPFPRESPAGYLIRLAERNGLRGSPALVGLVGGDAERIPGIGWDYRELQPLLGPMQCLAANFGYRDPSKHGRNRASLCGHLIWARHLDVIKPRICPQCVRELGYAPAAWDLKSYVACHVHGTLMLKHCTSCGNRLTNGRKGLLTCSCGADLSCMEAPVAPPGLLALAEVLWGVIYREESVVVVARQMGFPVEDLMRCDLRVVSKIIVQIATLYSWPGDGARMPQKDVAVVSLLPKVVDSLSVWPKGFHRLCKYWHAKSLKDDAPSKVFQIVFGWLFGHLHKNLRARKKQTVFLLKAALTYGYQQWDATPIRVKELAIKDMPEVSRRYGSYSDASKLLGLPLYSTVRWLLKGRLPARATGANRMRVAKTKRGRPNWVVDLERLKNVKLSASRGLRAREAAKFLEISIPVLRILRKDGDIPSNFATPYRSNFSVEDLVAFKEELLDGILQVDSALAIHPLKGILSGGAATIALKVRVLRAMRAGKIQGHINGRRSLSSVYLTEDLSGLRSGASCDELLSLKQMRLRYHLYYYEARAIALSIGSERRFGPPPKVHVNDVETFLSSYTALRFVFSGTGLRVMQVLHGLRENLPECEILRLTSGIKPSHCKSEWHALFIRRNDRPRVRRWVLRMSLRQSAKAAA